ncbi:hypothetical protein [Demetria terragena]|uniref:hypothetical protein n=1 Tax=Demetria terragena TaxID=63959 RepID=UPI000373E52F|nr:hypothetical protein [Demetria terragena]
MPKTLMTHRGVLATAAAGAALALTACGSDGVMNHGSTAATMGSYAVSTDEVQDAVSDITKYDKNSGITGQQAAVLMVLEPEITKVAARNNATVSPSQVREEYATQMPKGATLSDPAVRTILASVQLRALGAKGQAVATQTQKLVTTADIDLNPRYGEFDKGNMRPTAASWIKPTAPTSPQQ